MSDDNTQNVGVCLNTNRELWRERHLDYDADSIFVTEHGAIGINCGGTVIVMPVRDWHECGKAKNESDRLRQANTKLVCAIDLIRECLNGAEVQDLHNIINAALIEYRRAQKIGDVVKAAEQLERNLYALDPLIRGSKRRPRRVK